MNKNSYRIIYSKARQMFVAVAENVRSQTKTSGQSEASTQNNIDNTGSQAFHQLWQVKALVASISLWMPLAPVYAGIVADSAANAANRAVIGAGKNSAGTVVPVVNIQTPKNGISHNIYKQFDVLAEGAVLNNSRQGATTKTVGNVAANPFLATGEARVILNEVNSSAASRFEGNLEVAGQMADVIIANPSGINIKGGGFINANKAIFTTGKPQLNADGSIKQFTVDQGKITVLANPNSKFGLGGNNNDANYVDLYARALELSAELRAKNDIQVIAGANNVSADLQDVTAKTGTGTAPTLAVDVKALGGMYANNIYLMGTEKGLGVTNAGTIQAVNNLVITSAGKIENKGTIESTSPSESWVNIETIGIAADGDIINSGAIVSRGPLGIKSSNNININGGINLNGGRIQSTAIKPVPVIIEAKGDIKLSERASISNLKLDSSMYLNANNIELDSKSGIGSNGTNSIIANNSIILKNSSKITSIYDLDISAQKIDSSYSNLVANKGNINFSSRSDNNLLGNIELYETTLNAEGDVNLYSSGSTSLKNLDITTLSEGNSKIKNFKVYSKNDLLWDYLTKAPPQFMGKIQAEVAGKLKLNGKKLTALDGIDLQAGQLNLDSELGSQKYINITAKENDINLEKNLNAQSDINITALTGGITANSLKASSSAGKISILANKNINLNSTQTTKAMPSADKDELTTDQTVISGLKGVTLGSIGDGTVNLQSVQVNASQGDILVSSNNGINLKANTDVVVTGDTGRFKTVNNVLKGQTVSIENSKSDIKIQNTDLGSTVGKIAINSRAGMSTIIDSVLTSKGNTELYAKDLLTLQGVNATSDQHLAVSSGRTVYSNAEYTPATKWIADKVTNLTSKGVTSVTATGNQVLQNTNLTGGAVLLEAGGFILGQTGLNLNAVGSDLLKNDTKLNSLNGDLTIQTNSNLTIDPKVYSLKAVGDIELVSKTGTLTLKGYEGTNGNGSEQVVKLDTANGGINLEGTKVDIQGSQLIAKKDIQVVSTKDDLLIDGVRNSFSNIKFPDKTNREKIVQADFIQELNALKATQEYLNYQQALKDANDQIKAGEDWMRTAQGSIALTAKRLKDEGERKLAQVNETYKTLIANLNGLQRNIDQSGANISFYEQNLKGQQHASVNIKSNDGNINLVSAKGLSLSGSKVNAQQGEVRIEAAGTLTNNIYNIQGQYDSATENSVKQGAIASSIIIDANQDSYEFGNETDTTYAWRSPVDAPSIYGKKGVKIKATGTNTTDNLVLQGVDIRSEGDVNIEAHKNIIFDVAVESGYDKSTTTETKKKWYGKKTTTTTVNTSNKSEGVSVNINAKNINIKSKEQNTKEMTGKNRTSIDMYSSQFTATDGKISIQAGGDLNFLTALDVEQNTDDITKKSSFLGVKLNKSKTTATRNIQAELPATLKADYIGTKSGLDTRLKSPEFEYLSGATIEAGGVISLESASNVVEQTLKRDKNSVVWQSMQDKGSITETATLPSFNGPVLPIFKAAGGLSVQVPISEKDVNKVELRDTILDLSKKPGNEYLKELVNRKDVDWQTVLLTQKDWDYKSQGLTAAGAAIIVIIVTIVTMGSGTAAAAGAAGGTAASGTTVGLGASMIGTAGVTTTAAGAIVPSTLGVMANAAVTSLATQASVSLINNGGDISKTLKDLGSKETVKNLATSVVTAGALSTVGGLDWMEKLKDMGTDPNLLVNLAGRTGGAIIEAGLSAGISTSINGGSLTDNLQGMLLSSFATALQGSLASKIGKELGGMNKTDFENILHKIAHLAAGCVAGAIQKQCESGAIGAGIGEFVAEFMPAASGNGVYSDDEKERILAVGKILAAGVAGITGYDVNVASSSANTALLNNALSKTDVDVLIQNLKSCKNESQCRNEIQKAVLKSNYNQSNAVNCLSLLCSDNLEQAISGYNQLRGFIASGKFSGDNLKLLNTLLTQSTKDITLQINRLPQVQAYLNSPWTPPTKQQMAQIVIDILPMTSDPSAIYSIITGKAVVTQEEVSRFYAAVGLILPITIGRSLTKAEIAGLKQSSQNPLSGTVSIKDLPALPKSAQNFVIEQTAQSKYIKLLYEAKNDPSLGTWSTSKVGQKGEEIAVQLVKGSGFTDVISIQNASGNGIDIIAKNPQGNYVYLEVKTSAVGKIGSLSKRQEDMNFFVNDILTNAASKTGRYVNISDTVNAQAKTMLTKYKQQKAVGNVYGAAIGVDLKNAQILISSWTNK